MDDPGGYCFGTDVALPRKKNLGQHAQNESPPICFWFHCGATEPCPADPPKGLSNHAAQKNSENIAYYPSFGSCNFGNLHLVPPPRCFWGRPRALLAAGGRVPAGPPAGAAAGGRVARADAAADLADGAGEVASGALPGAVAAAEAGVADALRGARLDQLEAGRPV